MLPPSVIKDVQYNAIAESTMPKDVKRSSCRRNLFGLAKTTYKCVQLTLLCLFKHLPTINMLAILCTIHLIPVAP